MAPYEISPVPRAKATEVLCSNRKVSSRQHSSKMVSMCITPLQAIMEAPKSVRSTQVKEPTSFAHLPAELQLEILRYAFVATPPQIDIIGKLHHPLLHTCHSHVHRVTLDVILHMSFLTVSIRCMEYWRALEKQPVGLPFLKLHDQIHGKQKRHLMTLRVVGGGSTIRVEREWRQRARATGLLAVVERVTSDGAEQAWREWALAAGVNVELHNRGYRLRDMFSMPISRG